MATISLYKNEINEFPGLIKDLKSSAKDLKSDLQSMKKKIQAVDSGVCDLEDVISSITSATKTEEERISTLDTFSQEVEDFVSEAVTTDEAVADAVNQTKDDFYKKYSYLKPDSEKDLLDWTTQICGEVGQWCKDHWKDILSTALILIGAALAIVAVIASGGMALAPMLAALFTSIGISAGTALTAASVVSLIVASVAVISSVGSAALNIADVWGKFDNPAFNTWQRIFNWTSGISNGLYSIGGIYNSMNGISNTGLRRYSEIFFGRNEFVDQIAMLRNTSAFWSGLGKDGPEIAAKLAALDGNETLEMFIERTGVQIPEYSAATKGIWQRLSAAWAWNSSGVATSYLGDPKLTSTWRAIEYTILKLNPNVTSIVSATGEVIKYGFSFSFSFSCPFVSGISSMLGSFSNMVKGQ